jgi:hypothetical protein
MIRSVRVKRSNGLVARCELQGRMRALIRLLPSPERKWPRGGTCSSLRRHDNRRKTTMRISAKLTLRVAVAIAFMIPVAACTSSAPSIPRGDRWAIRIVGTDGRFVGGLVLEFTSQPTAKSCVGVPDMFVARITEKHGFADDYVRNEAAVYLKDGRLYADLSVNVCDHTLTISGRTNGTRAVGEASRSTLVGPMKSEGSPQRSYSTQASRTIRFGRSVAATDPS